jgi:hypothetical protein
LQLNDIAIPFSHLWQGQGQEGVGGKAMVLDSFSSRKTRQLTGQLPRNRRKYEQSQGNDCVGAFDASLRM